LRREEEVRAVPIYEYRCSKCCETFEAFQKINDQPLTECRFCQGKVEKLISHSSFQLKGSGWYLSDYAKKSQPAHSQVTDTAKTGEKTGTNGEKSSAAPAKTVKDSD
jgi:putative FmdB family regulatory protein